MKILVVDDSSAMRSITRRTLTTLPELAGATILEARDGREGLAIVETEVPDLVLCDWHMPEMTGIELLTALNDAGLTPPFGFVTSEVTPQMRTLAEAQGARFLVEKPVTAASLEAVLADIR